MPVSTVPDSTTRHSVLFMAQSSMPVRRVADARATGPWRAACSTARQCAPTVDQHSSGWSGRKSVRY
ncbi:MAG: hypothetical protein MZV64_42640 [Ignavibacteriales bacterium]|nr:hypothetical protein [Ignavibacteriales bacterium]